MPDHADKSAELVGRLEQLPFSRWHRNFFILAFLGVMFDAADFALFGAALPPIAREFGLNPAQAGLLATVGLVGAFLGALFWGTMSDYIGRRASFQATVGIFALFTGLVAASWNVLSLSVFRFLSNFGLGGEVPVTLTLTAEFSPGRIRGRMTGTMMAAFPVGLVVAAALSLAIVPNFGWRALFVVGVVPAVLLFFVRRYMPESVRYLLSKGQVAEAERTVEQIEQQTLGRVQSSDEAKTAADLQPEIATVAREAANPITVLGIVAIVLATVWWIIVYLRAGNPLGTLVCIVYPSAGCAAVAEGFLPFLIWLAPVLLWIGLACIAWSLATAKPGPYLSTAPVLQLLAPERRTRTILLWIVSFCFLWSSNGILFMLPTILTQRGIPLTQAISFQLVQALAAVVGYAACGFLIDRYGRRPVLFLYYFVGAFFHLWFAEATGLWMYAAIAAVGWVNPGVYGSTGIYVSELHPTHLRATAVGWFFGIGRIGSFLAPAVVGFMLQYGFGAYVLHTFALTFLIASGALLLVGIETKGLVLEQITARTRTV